MKFKFFLNALLLSLLVSSHANAIMPVDISVNNDYIKTDINPFIENGTVLAPARAVSEALGCDVLWDENNKTATITKEDKKISLTIGEKNAEVNGEKKELKKAAKIVNNRTVVPVRFIAENLGGDVFWNDMNYTVDISKDNHTLSDEHKKDEYTSNDVEWLAKIVHAEAQGEIMRGKIGVANVVLNRVESREFPNNIYDVIFDRKYGVQFTPVANGAIYNNPHRECYSAAKNALHGENTVGKSLYFCNPKISTNFWITNNRQFLTSIGRHDFYL